MSTSVTGGLRRQLRILTIVFTAAVSGCVVTSINPWLDTSGTAGTPPLSGAWVDAAKDAVATFRNTTAPGCYDVTISALTGTNRSAYKTSLHAVENRLLLQVGPTDCRESPGAVIPAYMLMRVDLTNDTMRLYQLDRRSFTGRAKKAGLILAATDPRKREGRFAAESEGIIVCSWTTDLEKFVRANMAETNFFSGEPVYSFVRSTGTVQAIGDAAPPADVDGK